MVKNCGNAALAGLHHLRFSPDPDVFDQLQHLGYLTISSLGFSDQPLYPGSKSAAWSKLILKLI